MEIKTVGPRVLAGSRCWNHPSRKVGDAKDTVGNARRNGRQARQVSAVVNAEGAKVQSLIETRAKCKALGIDPALLAATGRDARNARRKLRRAGR